MLIRSATLADARAIATIHVESWRAAYAGLVPEEHLRSLSIDAREARWRAILDARASQNTVIELGGAIVGWCSYGKSRDADAASHVGELLAVYVAPHHWGQGAGRELWLDARRGLAAAGFHEATLWVLRDNARARRFYTIAGFSPDPGSEKLELIGGAELAEVRLRAPLRFIK